VENEKKQAATHDTSNYISAVYSFTLLSFYLPCKKCNTFHEKDDTKNIKFQLFRKFFMLCRKMSRRISEKKRWFLPGIEPASSVPSSIKLPSFTVLNFSDNKKRTIQVSCV
jgi:hypothetical protein